MYTINLNTRTGWFRPYLHQLQEGFAGDFAAYDVIDAPAYIPRGGVLGAVSPPESCRPYTVLVMHGENFRPGALA